MSAPVQADRRAILAGMGALALTGVAARGGAQDKPPAPQPGVTRIDPRLDAIVASDARIEVLGRGYKWAEGGVWVPRGDYLLFADPPNNIVYRWDAKGGVAPFLNPSGLQTPVPEGIKEPGANGMRLDRAGRLVFADSGTRAIVRVDLTTRKRTVLADRYQGKRFNSPNDLAIAKDGTIYFSDPPYGLKDADASPLAEIGFNGLYRLTPDGKVTLVDRSRFRPNGVALSPDGRTLYLALSDPKLPQLLAYDIDARGMPGNPRVLHDMARWQAQGLPGLPDGVKTAPDGTIFATGPGGVHVLGADGTMLGLIATGKAVANCCIGQSGRTLFMASHDMLCRVALRAG
ncbi:SMP-30/gluconolactonase/LRE family protein [Sphingobium amiense]|uniref:SMP-30/gluconolactonase/LRE family protein n=1 Tax=Sphingobium amiense TaxID=135719 RepID=A0A494VZZ8_9SPHN|nr:SMP-30/gluconolactonase/LRE family protein [Sphingobium amiense]BBD96706.1 SMP-30/gluconolactonase/LRE family protein [Sphingobium amiense]